MGFNKRLFASVAAMSINLLIYSQHKDSIKLLGNYIPVDSIVNALQTKHQVKIFYNPSWYEGKELLPEILNLPLPEALNLIARISNLSYQKFRESYYVITPNPMESDNKIDSLQFYTIGDIMSYGSKENAVIRGTVINGSTADILVNAKITVENLNKSFTTDHKGNYVMNIPVGEHEIKVGYPGFEDKVMKLKVFSDGSLPVEMFVKSIMLEEVSVTSVKIDQYYRRTKMSVMNLDAKSIKQLPSTFGETDVIKSLSLLPGIQTAGEFGSGFNVRGGSSDQNLILLEEVPLFNTSHLFGLISIVNPDGVAGATLYKGGLPASYGERASSILSIKMGEEDLKETRVKGGIGLLNSRLSVEIPYKDKLQVIAGGRTSYSDWMLRKIPDEDLMNSEAGFNDFNLYVNYNLTKKDNLIIYGYASNDKFSLSGINTYKYGNLLGSLNFSHRFNSKLFTNLLLGVSQYHAEMVMKDSLQPASSYQTNNSILYQSAKWNMVYKPGEKHIFTIGVNGFLYNIAPGELKGYGEKSLVLPQKVEEENGLEWAGFISDDYKISGAVGIEFGVRYSGFTYLGPGNVYLYNETYTRSAETITDTLYFKDKSEIKTWSGVEPRFLMRWNLNTLSSVRFSFNRNFQYINLISKTSVSSPTDLWKLSDTYIKPLHSDQFALGYFKDFRNKSYETSVEIYYKTYSNLIDYKNEADIFLNNHIETELADAEGISYGFELYIKKNSGKLNGWLSYTLSRSIRRTTSPNPDEQVNNNEWYSDNLDRPHNLVVNGGYDINRRWKFGFIFNFNSGRPVSLPELKYNLQGYQVVKYSNRNEYKMPDYHRLDLSITRFESLKLNKKWKGYWTVSIINIYSRKNAYSIFYQRDRSPNNNEGRSNLYKLYIIGRPLPTFTYNFTF
jgi:hypothetical protein